VLAFLGLLAGIGFTMSLSVGGLAFDSGGMLASAKLGILSTSVISAIAGLASCAAFQGWSLLRTSGVRRPV